MDQQGPHPRVLLPFLRNLGKKLAKIIVAWADMQISVLISDLVLFFSVKNQD
jgi:hypothetical protein